MHKQCILFLLVGLVAGGLSSNAGRWSKIETDTSDVQSPAYEGASSSPSNEQNQDTSSDLTTSNSEFDNGLLEKILKRKIELKNDLIRLQLTRLAAGVSSANEDEQMQSSSSLSNGLSQDYRELGSPMSSANENVSDNKLIEKLNKEKERLREAFVKYDEVISTCKREIELSKDNVLSSKKQIDAYIQQQKLAKELKKQI